MDNRNDPFPPTGDSLRAEDLIGLDASLSSSSLSRLALNDANEPASSPLFRLPLGIRSLSLVCDGDLLPPSVCPLSGDRSNSSPLAAAVRRDDDAEDAEPDLLHILI